MPKLLYANTHNSDMFYAVGVPIPDPFFLLDLGDKQLVFLDSREFGVFNDHEHKPGIEAVLTNAFANDIAAMKLDGSPANQLGLFILKKYDVLGTELQVPENFPLELADFLRANGATLTPVPAIFPERLIKRPDEVEAIRDALKRTHLAFDFIKQVLHDSNIVGDELHYNGQVLTSESVKAQIDKLFLENDMLNLEGLIVSCGPHAAIPHHTGKGPLRPHQTIICDIFPRVRSTGFYADMTRTFVKGQPSEYQQKMYNAVSAAQDVAFEKLVPGATGADVHNAVVESFNQAGFTTTADEGFIHGTGHGLGLDIHELPHVKTYNTDPFVPGHVVTNEPGLYYHAHGGVRIEDVVVITDDGNQNLTSYSKDDWIIV